MHVIKGTLRGTNQAVYVMTASRRDPAYSTSDERHLYAETTEHPTMTRALAEARELIAGALVLELTITDGSGRTLNEWSVRGGWKTETSPVMGA